MKKIFLALMAVATIALAGCKNNGTEPTDPQQEKKKEPVAHAIGCQCAVTLDILDFYSVTLEYQLPDESKQTIDAVWEDKDGVKVFSFYKETMATGTASQQLIFTRNATPVNKEDRYTLGIGTAYYFGDAVEGGAAKLNAVGQMLTYKNMKGEKFDDSMATLFVVSNLGKQTEKFK